MKIKRSNGFLIGTLILLAALPMLVQSDDAWLGTTGQQPKELTLQDIEIVQIAADRAAESAVIDAPHPFNAVVAEWLPSANPFFSLEIRTGQDGEWGNWQPLQVSADMTVEGDERVTGSMIFVDGGQSTHEQVQLRSSVAGVVEDARLTFIDSTEGPTTAELVASMDALRAADLNRSSLSGTDTDTKSILANPKPNIISRDAWCTAELCRPNEGLSSNDCVNADPLKYVDVTHLVVHHTVTSNDAPDWAPVVRAIWNYHAFSRCWGDIGYNYLIDPNGNIYEGHRGGEDVSGSHAGTINADSMGVSLLGTFTEAGPPYYGIKPPTAMANALVDILAWKADQKQIDPWDSSWAKSLGQGRPNLMGHRDAHGTTTCPGQQAFEMLPEIRQRVAERLDFVPDRIYVDELSSNFSKSNATWYTGEHSCGFNGHAWFTHSTSSSSESANVGTWTMQVPADGLYVVEAMVPFCNTGKGETSTAAYRINHAQGSDTVVINQDDYVGLWAKVGSFEFEAGTNYTLRLTDLTDDNGLGVWFDAIRLTPATDDDLPDPKFSLTAPADNAWLNRHEIDFEWRIDNFFGPQQIALRLSTTADMQSEIYNQTLTPGLTSTSVTLNQDYPDIYWQIQALGSNNGTSEVKRLAIDTTPPETRVGSVLKQEDGSYFVMLTGSDYNGSGIKSYSVHYRVANSGNDWAVLENNITSNVARFDPNDELVYEFRVAGLDNLGNIEPFVDGATGSTADAILIRPQAYLPLISNQ